MLEELVNIVDCGLCRITLDKKMTISYANPYFYRIISPYLFPDGREEGKACFCQLLNQVEYETMQRNTNKCIENKQEGFELETCLTGSGEGPLWLLIKCRYKESDNTLICAVMDVTKQKEREEALRISEETNRIAVVHENIMTLRYDVQEKILYTPRQIALQFDIPDVAEDWPDSVREGLILESSQGEFKRFYEKMALGVPYGHVKLQMRDKNKEVCWYSGAYTMIYDAQGHPVYGVISFKDHNEQWKKELAYEKWRQMYESWRGESIGYYEVNLSGNRIERIEGRISGFLPSAQNMKFTDLVCCTAEHFIYPEDWKEYLSAFSREGLLQRFFSGERSFQLEHRRLDEAGRVFWAMADLLIFKDPYSENIMCFVTVKDINASKQSLMDLEERSKKDILTGLFNRLTTMEKIHEVFRDYPEQTHGLVMLDIDNYKKLNDTLGHVFGDRVLKEISSVLKKNVGTGDIVGRIGGDEFIICLKNIQSREELLKRLKRLCTSLHKTYPDGTYVTGSFGASVYPKDGRSFEELYPKADAALYEAKHLGRNQYAIYDGDKKYPL